MHGSNNLPVWFNKLNNFYLGGSPSLVVMGGDSYSEGCRFKSRHRILDGHFSHIFVIQIEIIFVWKDQKQMIKEAGIGLFLKEIFSTSRQVIIVLTQLEGSGGFSIAHRLTHRLATHPGLHDWAPSNVEHLPNLDNKVDGLHSPRPLWQRRRQRRKSKRNLNWRKNE